MASRGERILAAIEAALKQPSVTIRGVVHAQPAGLSVHRSRELPIEQDEIPATVVYPLEQAVELNIFAGGDDESPYNSRKMTVRLEHRAIGMVGSQALDSQITWGTRALLADPSLGGLAIGIEEQRIRWDGELSDRAYAAAGQDFVIEFETPEDDPEG